MTSTAIVLQGDAVATVALLGAGAVDAVIMDPPYCSGSVSEASRSAAKGQGLRSETLARFGWFVGDNMGTAGLVWLMRAVAFASVRVVKRSGSLLVFCDWRMVPSVVPAIESAGWRYQNLIVWDKGSPGLGAGFRAQHELVAHFTNGEPAYHDKSTSNVLRSGRVHHTARVHQTEKPVELLRRLVRVTTPPDGVVLDPFAGSGSTAVAALLEGRSAIGIERDAAHVATARRRLAELLGPDEVGA